MHFRRYLLALAIAFAVLPLSQAQEQVICADPPPSNPWATNCSSKSRAGAADCQLSQRAVSAQTRRLLAALTLRFPPDGAAANMLVTIPVGISLAAGVTIDVDGSAKQTLPVDACDRNGCYASMPVSADLLTAMQAGQKFNIAVQNTQKQVATIPLSLTGFTAAYNSVK
jgi:invasion protein IalB